MHLTRYPPPFKCWLSLNSDPDSTQIEDWREVHELIWVKLKLPFADSLFISNQNPMQPGQVNAVHNPEIVTAHAHDTIHAWGDFQFSPRQFARADAEEALTHLRGLGFTPLVWTDHSSAPGNLIHNASVPQVPCFETATGYRLANPQYSRDVVWQAGVRYVWDGTIRSKPIGHDRAISRLEWYRNQPGETSPLKAAGLAALDLAGRPLWNAVGATRFNYIPGGNGQYRRYRFPDGHVMYTFPRFGQWRLADIQGLGELLGPSTVEDLAKRGGTAIVYTHLGQRRADRTLDKHHIPERTRESLLHLARVWAEGLVKLSSTSELLDYLVIRDHCLITGRIIDFQSDGIRFQPLTAPDLQRFTFGVASDSLSDVEVRCHGKPIRFDCERLRDGLFSLRVTGGA